MQDKMYGAVFKTENLVTGKLYIGQTTGKRNSYIGSGIYLKCTVKKYGKENFKRINLKSCNCQEDLDFWEKHYIKEFNSLVPGGYNLDLGGKGIGKHSEETKKKLSEANKGENHSMFGKYGKNNQNFGKCHAEEHKRKISEAMKGKPISEETKKKLSIAHTGKHFSKEHKRKLSESKSGKNHYNFGKCHTEETKRKISEAMGKVWEKRNKI